MLVVRLWLEKSHDIPLRARISKTLDTDGGEESVGVAASADDICVIVKDWVDTFVDPARAGS